MDDLTRHPASGDQPLGERPKSPVRHAHHQRDGPLVAAGALGLQAANSLAVDFQDVMNAFIQRVGVMLIVIFLTRKCVNDAIWRAGRGPARKAGRGWAA